MQEFTLRLTSEDLSTLSEALGTRPYKKVSKLINTINIQLSEQMSGAPPENQKANNG